MAKLSRMAAIVGVDESDEIGKVPNKSRLQHGSEAAFNALDDAGLSLSDVDGLFVAGPSPYNMAEYMGFTPKYTDGTNVGGSSFIIYVEHALAAISAGLIDVALIVHGEAGRSTRSYAGDDPNMPIAQYEHPYGLGHRASRLRLGLHTLHARVRRGAHSQRPRRDSRVYP